MSKKGRKANIGIDLVDVARFKFLMTKRNKHLLEKLFTRVEINYCAKFKDGATHLAGIFAAKEAASKAIGASAETFQNLEVRHDAHGAPEMWYQNKRSSLKVSITHTRDAAAAVALDL